MSSRAEVAVPLAMAGELVSRSPRCEAQKRLRPDSDIPFFRRRFGRERLTRCFRARFLRVGTGGFHMGNGPDLETVIRQLHSSDIRMGFQTYQGGILLWVSDRFHRVRAERVFDEARPLTPEDSAAAWLHITALRLFPGSDHARLASTSMAKAQSGDVERAINHRV
jgi:hypothetical protein